MLWLNQNTLYFCIHRSFDFYFYFPKNRDKMDNEQYSITGTLKDNTFSMVNFPLSLTSNFLQTAQYKSIENLGFQGSADSFFDSRFNDAI